MNKSDWEIIDNFEPEETYCNCGCGHGPEKMNEKTMIKLDIARRIAGIVFELTSAYRCEAHNNDVGGIDSSAHVEGYAVDIGCTDSRSRYIILDALRRAGFTRIGIAETFIHVDDDPDKDPKVAWVY